MDVSHTLRSAKSGDTAALEELLAAFRPRVRRIAQDSLSLVLTRRCDESDLAQLTLLTAATALSAFRGETEGEFTAWLQAILRQHVATMHRLHVQAERRSVNREQPSDTDAFPMPSSIQGTPSRLLLHKERRQEIDDALEHLPWEQREAVRLRFLDEWSTGQIAEFLGKTERAVAGLIRRGISQLKGTLRNW